jgi:Outer membrane protein beta-barrel domain
LAIPNGMGIFWWKNPGPAICKLPFWNLTIMIKIIVLFFGLCSITAVKSQVLIALLFGEKLNTGSLEFGLNAGLNLSDINGLPDGQMKTGLNLALYFNIRINDRLYIHPEAIPKYPGGVRKLKPYSLNDSNLDQLFADGEVTRKIKNIAVPILVRYRVINLLFAEAGPQLGLRTKANDIFKSGNLTYEKDIRDQITRWDFGVAFGVSQRLRKGIGAMAIGVRYYFGLTDIDKLEAGVQKNGILQFNLNIPIGAGGQKKNDGKDSTPSQ